MEANKELERMQVESESASACSGNTITAQPFSNPTSIQVMTTVDGICQSCGASNSRILSCNPSFSINSYELNTFMGDTNCCQNGGSCVDYGSGY